ncbi:MAG: tryptophan-rich sensory protein [Sphingomonadales bacterium]|nr:tryptophan-rich sensory protein [Sphingomonadales bacterium]MDE2568178.1 tryptophan-rich sensory protein [Sphingomonadales bacterium]
MQFLASPAQLRASLLRWSLFIVPVIVALGFLSGMAAGSGPDNPWFAGLAKPAIYPPPVTFPIVWSVLYVLMGVALAMVLSARGAAGRSVAFIAFIVQLLLNLAWSPIFFALHQVGVALGVIVALALVLALTIALFARIRPLAAWLLAPCLVWVCFAGVLNWQFARLNPDAATRSDSGASVRMEL